MMLLEDYKESMRSYIDEIDAFVDGKGQVAAFYNSDEIFEPIKELERLAQQYFVEEIACLIYLNPTFRIMTGSGSVNLHHYGVGGLARHTLEVVQLCLNTADMFPQYAAELPRDKVYLAALYHDAGKMFDYTDESREEDRQANFAKAMREATWKKTPHAHKIHHICRSAIIWTKNVAKIGYPRFEEMEDDVLHAIVSHHAWREWGSPCAPQTRLAWLLHLCDSLSARMNDCSLNLTKPIGNVPSK